MTTIDKNLNLNHPERQMLRVAFRFVDLDGDGLMDYEDFYDVTHQFGMHSEINVYETFRVSDCDNSGLVPIRVFEAALNPTKADCFFLA
jgi:Ca2+-binding EF-hand superfamily protein